jgi:ABC-2 type transport system permease protein
MASRIFIVTKSEFLKRVQTRWFVLTTLLAPLALILFFVVIGYVTVKSLSGGEERVAVVDPSGLLFDNLIDGDGQTTFVQPGMPEDSVRAMVIRGQFTGYLKLDPNLVSGEGKATYFSRDGGGASIFARKIRSITRQAVEKQRLEELNVAPAIFNVLNATVEVDMQKLSDSGEASGGTEAFAALGFIMGFLIYITMLIYGSVVMQGVIQEKTNRVVEVIISSVSPFDLLMGKVLGIGAMGLLQMSFWAILIAGGSMFSGVIISMFLDPASLNIPTTASRDELLAAANITIPVIDPFIFVWFVLFFLLGYLLYASLFSAIGSSVEQQQDAQSLMLPVMLPIIMSMVFMQSTIEAPNSTLSVVLSMIPFTSPISMMVRFAVTDVPIWQMLLSFSILVSTFIGSIWVSARIYRVGVLMYGKKASIKDLIKWIRLA